MNATALPPRKPFISPVITVSDLTNKIKLNLENSFPLLCVEGEISNFKRQASGHLYFSLKDAGAQISAVMFRSAASQLQRLPSEGDQVVVKAQLTVYPGRGSYQLVVQELTLSGTGELLLQLEKLKEHYKRLGYFDREGKKPLPSAPRVIGVITSPTGAVIRDILNVLNRRHTGFHVLLNPVKVQGEGAAEEIAAAIDHFNRHQLAEVLIVARGGGSIEDLWAFNTAPVIEAIHRSRLPVISAVGHETDHTLADFVADVRAPTPSAAAEIVLEETASRAEKLLKLKNQLLQGLQRHLVFAKRRLEWLNTHPLMASSSALLQTPNQRVDEGREQLDRTIHMLLERRNHHLRHAQGRLSALKPQNQILHMRQRLGDLSKAMDRAIANRLAIWKQRMEVQAKRAQLDGLFRRLLSTKQERLSHLTKGLEACNPKSILSRGYAILLSEKDGHPLQSVHQLSLDESVRMVMSDGEVTARITDKQPQRSDQ